MKKFRFKSLYIHFLKFRRSFKNYPFRQFNYAEVALFWMKNRMTRSQFLVLSGVLVGLTAGIAAVILKTLVHNISEFVNNDVPFEERVYIYAIFPLLGIVLTALIVRYFFRGDEDKELSYVLKQIAKNDSKIKSNKMYSQIIQSAVTVGFGGSAGLETPIALTGSAIGSNYSQRYRLGFKERTLLLAAGAAAGIAAAFNAPIAGVMFAFEIILAGLVFTDFIPLVIAAISGSLVSNMILKEDAIFYFSSRETFEHVNIFFYVGLGLLTGIYARYFLLVSQKVHQFFELFKNQFLWKAVVGGLVLAVLCVAFPPLFGEGYGNIRALHQGRLQDLLQESWFRYFDNSTFWVVVFLGVTVLLKALATSVTLGSGGNGGNFAPSLISGGMLGFLYGFVLQQFGIENVPLTNLMLVGMAGVLSGAMYAPLTAIFLIAESSSGYDLFIPLMMVSVIAYSINRFFSPINPVYKKLSENGEIFTTRQDQNILSQISLKSCMNPDTLVIDTSESMAEILEKFRKSDETVVAVVDLENQFWGILNREQLRPYLLGKQDSSKVKVSNLAIEASNEVGPEDSVMKIIKMFDEADVWQLPVLDEERKFIGFVSRARILSNYRKLLKAYSE